MTRALKSWVPAIAALPVLLGGCKARNLASKAAPVRVSSSGSATLRVSDSLEVNITSSGSVRYHGSPSSVNGNVTSSGRLMKTGD